MHCIISDQLKALLIIIFFFLKDKYLISIQATIYTLLLSGTIILYKIFYKRVMLLCKYINMSMYKIFQCYFYGDLAQNLRLL